MIHIHVKESEQKIDPKHPQSTDERYSKAVAVGRERLRTGELKFKSAGEERDYWKAVDSNPGNVAGLPAFFPPLRIRDFVPSVEVTEEDIIEAERQRLTEMQRITTILFCGTCTSNQPHVVSPWEGYCQKCGTQKNFRTK
jgi:hypothetical protein